MTEAQKSPEKEVCGLIGLSGGENMRFYPVENAASEPDRLFEMDPEGQIEAMRVMRETGETLFAIFHSHPHAPARPSATDLAESTYPEALHLIISLDTKGVLQLAGFRIREGGAEEVELEMAG